jgi:metallopeptidase family M12-like protein/pre-peptidase/uncharacterized protein DUF4214
LKRTLYLTTFLITALVCCLAIAPTEARREPHSSAPSSDSQKFDLIATPRAELLPTAQTGAQKSQPVSGQLIQTNRQDPELAKALRDYDLIRLDPRAAAAQIRDSGKLVFTTSKGTFEVQLAVNDMRSSDYVAQVITAEHVARKLPKLPVNTYKGSVLGSPGTQARITVNENSVEGAIITASEHYFVQPARSLSKNASEDEFVFYKGSDLTGEAGSCGVTLADEVAAEETRTDSYRKITEAAEAAGPITGLSPLKIARLATEADAEYVAALGGAAQANAQIASIMNMVDGIYQVEIGVTFRIAFQNAWANAATDPYTSTAASSLLGEFRSHWNANFTSVQRSLAHMWTGKDLDGSTIGISALAVVCRTPQQAYGLSQKFPFNNNSITARTVILTAHEIGHGFSALHTNEPDDLVPPDIEQACEETIMEGSVGDGSSFCTFSRSQIIGHANAYGSCLTDSGPAPSLSCSETPITSGVDTNGTISTSDCQAPSRGAGHFADRYSFNATAGQQVIITMAQSSGNIDPYLYLIGPDGYVVTQNDDQLGSNNSMIGGSGGFTLSLSGKYVIEATSFDINQTGNYVLNLSFVPCSLTVNPTSQHFPASGGTGTISVTPSGFCQSYSYVSYPASASSWLIPQIIGSGTLLSLPFNVQPNTNAAGRRGFILVAPTPTFGEATFGGLRIPITQSGTGPDCAVASIASGQTINGILSTTDCQSPIRGNGFYTDRYSFDVTAGQQVAISLSSSNAPTTDTFLTLMGPNGVVLLTDDDSGGSTNSRIPGGPGTLTLGLPGTYIIEVNTFDGELGPYVLSLTTGPPTPNAFSVSGRVADGSNNGIGGVTVLLESNFQGTPSTTTTLTDAGGNYSSSDLGCQNSVKITPSKTGYAFSPLNISFVSTGCLSGIGTANFTATNPLEDPSFFVSQHYRDFLGREPDAGGLAYWTNEITQCGNDPLCIKTRRVGVSAAFFVELEFQRTGSFVYRLYKGGLARRPSHQEFNSDRAQVVEGPNLEATKQALGLAFVQRNEFVQKYASATTAEQFVTQLTDSIFVSSGVPFSQAQRSALINTYNTGADINQSRAFASREAIDNAAFISAEYNKAFVLMQYFGYLQRDIDQGGYDFWLGIVNNPSVANYHSMVCAFITSQEYQQRFGSLITRNDTECAGIQ